MLQQSKRKHKIDLCKKTNYLDEKGIKSKGCKKLS